MAEENEKKPEVKKKFDPKEMLVEGCIVSQAKEVISQMLERRLAELDPTGIQAKFVMRLQNEISDMPDCSELLEGTPAGTPEPDEEHEDGSSE